jgi:hypothetical protein
MARPTDFTAYPPRRPVHECHAENVAIDRRPERTRRSQPDVAGPLRRGHLGGQCRGAQGLRHEFERLPRNPVVPVRRRGHARLRLHHAAPGARQDRCHRRPLFQAHPTHRRMRRHRVFPLSLRLQGQSTGLAAGDPGLPQRRDVAERRRPDPLAGVCPGTHRLHPAGIAGSVGIDQAHRLPARHCRRSNGAGANQDGRGRTGRGNPQASSRPRSGRACRGFPRHACGQEQSANGSTK